MGHASRIVPIIDLLIKQGPNIIIATNGLQKKLLMTRFPNQVFVDIIDYNIEYSSNDSQILKLFMQIPKIIKAIKTEHIQLKKIIKNHNIDIVISDNRYGLYNKNIKSIFITHQTYIKIPSTINIFEKLINSINTKCINKFDVCWVPDKAGLGNFSGDLSHKNKLIKNIKYIGIISKFNEILNLKINNDVLVILSGLEPQRSIFESIIEERLGDTNYKVIIVRGNLDDKKSEYGNIDYISFADTEVLNNLIYESEIIISRSGYSSILDYIKLGKKAIIVPTPGQTADYTLHYFRSCACRHS